MSDQNYRASPIVGAQTGAIDQGLRAFMLRVYNYMLLGLTLTGATAFLVANTSFGQVFFTTAGGQLAPTVLGWIAIFAPLGLRVGAVVRHQPHERGHGADRILGLRRHHGRRHGGDPVRLHAAKASRRCSSSPRRRSAP